MTRLGVTVVQYPDEDEKCWGGLEQVGVETTDGFFVWLL